jgi:L-seryl-tRNA(Ser) seleniumtransferase
MEALKQIPPVNDILLSPELSGFGSILSQPFVARFLKAVLSDTRKRVVAGELAASRKELTSTIAAELAVRLNDFLTPSLRRVINASGVVLHTNLGRAPLPASALDYLKDVSRGYSNLEFHIEKGGRGKRDSHLERLFGELLGSEAAIVVNNNAFAVLLVLNSLAEGGEVIASRGEQVEIGGSFRIPEVMEKSGAVLREVGTTNRTRIGDFDAAINSDTRLLLRVHPSNFRVIGFTENPSVEEFADLGRRRGITTFEDLGSGCLVDMNQIGVSDEPLVGDSIRAGVDVVCFSGDKLLGGPQAGIIAGRKALIGRIRDNPWFRALRADKMTLSVLEMVLLTYLKGEVRQIPVWRMLLAGEDELKDRADAFVRRAGDSVSAVKLTSLVGGGSAPEATLPSWGVTVRIDGVSEAETERRFRNANPAVIVRMEDHRVVLDMRTVAREEEDELIGILKAIS